MGDAIWICVALWAGFNVAFLAMRLHLTRRLDVTAAPSPLPALRLVR